VNLILNNYINCLHPEVSSRHALEWDTRLGPPSAAKLPLGLVKPLAPPLQIHKSDEQRGDNENCGDDATGNGAFVHAARGGAGVCAA
jgi:hypothetical protein